MLYPCDSSAALNPSQFHPVSPLTPQTQQAGRRHILCLSEIHLALAIFNSGSLAGWKQCSEPCHEPAGREHLGVAAALAGGAAPTPALCSHLFPPDTPAHLKVSLMTTGDLKHRNRRLESGPMIFFSASLCLSWDL